MSARPLIGITAYSHFRKDLNMRFDTCYERNAVAIDRAGGLPVLIPVHGSQETLRRTFERMDGILLPGGGDVNPSCYHDHPHQAVYGVSDARDRMEIAMTQWAFAADLPLFGICRGIQVVNVAMGGSLTQDIPTQVDTDLRHDILHDGSEARHLILHDVCLEHDSQLAAILGTDRLPVNSLHHQTLKAVAPQATITAHATDGLVEAIEFTGKRFALAVQWHPEDLIEHDARMLALFEHFVQAARDGMCD